MCLSKITKHQPKPEGVGYKVFWKEEDELCAPFRYSWSDPLRYKPDQWITDAKDKQIGYLHRSLYTTGFHVFERKKDAEVLLKKLTEQNERPNVMGKRCFVLARVKYRRSVVRGKYVIGRIFCGDSCDTQPRTCIVAKEMFIEKIY
jgi:hypothetical protein